MRARALPSAAAVPLTAMLLLTLRHPADAQAGPEATSPRPRPATVAAIALSIKSRAVQDSRCYLMTGGAVESFFVSEDTPVGSVIGTLSVNGDPSEAQGDITLRLQERGAAVGIAAGTKNLTLLRALDREERQGPSNVYVNVRCDRRHTSDPSFIIPVSVRVWDVNDNAPVWSGAPYRVRLSELTAVGSRVLPALRATDADQPGPHATIHYSVLPGDNSEYFGFANELDSVLVVKKPLDFETLSNFTVTLRAQDQGSPPLHNDTTLFVEVLDADDQNPKFTHDHYTAILPENAQVGTFLETFPGPISAVDQDVGINAPLFYSSSGDNRDLLSVDRDSGRVAVTKKLLETQHLPVTIVIKATQVDNADRYALATLSVSAARRGGSAGVRFSRRAYSAAVPEDAPPGAALLELVTEPEAPRDGRQNPLQFYVSDRSFLDKFAINSAGEVLLRRALDYETANSYYYQVMVTDGVANDTASINITVSNVNEWEPRFRYPQYEFRVEGDAGSARAGLLPVGKLDVFDGDTPDTVALTLRGADATMFYMNDAGEMFLKAEALSALNSSTLHVVATAVDSGTPPRQTSVPVIVHVSERLMSRELKGAGVLVVFAAALALLAILVCALLAYIYRVRRAKQAASSGHSHSKAGFVSHEKPRSPLPAPAPAPSGSLLSVSAGASTILANSTSSLNLPADTLPTTGTTRSALGRQSQRFPSKSKVAPQPPSTAPAAAGPGGGLSLMSDHIHGAAGRSGVAWPSSTIPARVKKLSWDERDTTDHDDFDHDKPARARRHQPRAAGTHEPHRLFLNETTSSSRDTRSSSRDTRSSSRDTRSSSRAVRNKERSFSPVVAYTRPKPLQTGKSIIFYPRGNKLPPTSRSLPEKKEKQVVETDRSLPELKQSLALFNQNLRHKYAVPIVMAQNEPQIHFWRSPPSYATVTPQKLRTIHVRPSVYMRPDYRPL
ncbi:protocadherin-16 isoform X2 [Plodia interpunctella]|uniref:protocadherin-16 isoform X2 n=1 Tax=Plodia interpunctella TaxID=58824 RepID=UPI002367F2B8|nr:protocadherin-16 isoform X2 [Plodia interpunctella]